LDKIIFHQQNEEIVFSFTSTLLISRPLAVLVSQVNISNLMMEFDNLTYAELKLIL